MRKGRIKYYFKNKNAVINDVGKLCDMNEQLEQELERYKNIIDELEKYICKEWYCFDNESVEFEVSRDILNKLKELKGSDN